MWDMKANAEGELTFEIQDKEGQVVELVFIDNLQPEEELFIEMFDEAGEIRLAAIRQGKAWIRVRGKPSTNPLFNAAPPKIEEKEK